MNRVRSMMIAVALGGCADGGAVGQTYAPAYGYSGGGYPTNYGYAADYAPPPAYIAPAPEYLAPSPAYVGPPAIYYDAPAYAQRGPGWGYGDHGHYDRGYGERRFRGTDDRDRGGSWNDPNRGAERQQALIQRQQALVQQQQHYNSQIVDAQRRYNDRISANPQGAPAFREQLTRDAADARRQLEQNTRGLRN